MEPVTASLKFIVDALQKDPASKVLIHCQMGLSRSVSLGLAYLMYKYGWNLEYAMNYLVNLKDNISPNINFYY